MGLHFTQDDFKGQTPATINEVNLSGKLAQLAKGILWKTDFQLRIMIVQSQVRLKKCNFLFRVIAPLYDAFRAEGADVRVSWC
jgi:hypothetical protein